MQMLLKLNHIPYLEKKNAKTKTGYNSELTSDNERR